LQYYVVECKNSPKGGSKNCNEATANTEVTTTSKPTKSLYITPSVATTVSTSRPKSVFSTQEQKVGSLPNKLWIGILVGVILLLLVGGFIFLKRRQICKRYNQTGGQHSNDDNIYTMTDNLSASTNNQQNRNFEDIESENFHQQSGNNLQKSRQLTSNSQLNPYLGHDSSQFDGAGKKSVEHCNIKDRTVDAKVSDTAGSSNMTVNVLYDSYQPNQRRTNSTNEELDAALIYARPNKKLKS